MRVAYDHQIFSFQRFGGISRYFFELATRLADLPDIDVEVLAGFYVNEYGLEKRRERLSRFMGWKQPDWPIPKSDTLFYHLNNLLVNRALAQTRVDLFHQTFFFQQRRPPGSRTVLTMYDMTTEIFPESFAPASRITPQKRAAVEQADGVICISHNTRKDLIQHFGVPESKIRVIHLANSLDIQPSPQPAVEQPYVLFVGMRGGYKNFAGLLRAFAAADLPSAFQLVCFGGGAFTVEEQQLIAGLGLEARVRLLGGGDELLATLYSFATAFVYPSLYEGFGIPPLEAMHYGCPVLVAPTSSIPEVVEDAGLYFEPGCEGDLVAQLTRIVHDEDLRRSLIAKGYAQERKFSWERVALETAAYYRDVLKS